MKITNFESKAGSVALGILFIVAAGIILIGGCNIARKLQKMPPRTIPDGDGTNSVSSFSASLQEEYGPTAKIYVDTFVFVVPSYYTVNLDQTNVFMQVATSIDGPWADAENQDDAFKYVALCQTDRAMAVEMTRTNLYFKTNSSLFFRQRMALP